MRGQHGGPVALGPERRVDLEDGVVVGHAVVGESEVVRRDLGRHGHSLRPRPTYELEGRGRRQMEEVDAGADGRRRAPGRGRP